jgi:hypothetical protein
MNFEVTMRWLDAYLDGELEPFLTWIRSSPKRIYNMQGQGLVIVLWLALGNCVSGNCVPRSPDAKTKTGPAAAGRASI